MTLILWVHLTVYLTFAAKALRHIQNTYVMYFVCALSFLLALFGYHYDPWMVQGGWPRSIRFVLGNKRIGWLRILDEDLIMRSLQTTINTDPDHRGPMSCRNIFCWAGELYLHYQLPIYVCRCGINVGVMPGVQRLGFTSWPIAGKYYCCSRVVYL